jgi:YegS/Rv2252/BmrU family lipid kinase
MYVLLIYNSNAGNHSFYQNLDIIISKFQAKDQQIIPYKIDEIDKFLKFFRNLNPRNYSKVLIAGGDGTLNLVITQMLKYGWQTPIGIYPAGTANDYANYFKLPKKIEDITDIYTENHFVYSDVGCVNNNYFVNVLSLGFLVNVAQKTGLKAKNRFGVLAYYLKGLEEAVNVSYTPISLETKAIKIKEEIILMLVLNGTSAGGFNKMLFDASVSDGLLDVLIFKKCPIYELLPLFIKLINGEHVSSQYVMHFKTDYLKIDADENVLVDLDGEKSVRCPLEINVCEKVINVLVPKEGII